MNVSEIITAFGAYYLNSGQNMNNILRMLTQGAVTPSFMTPIKTEETIYRMSSVTVGSLVQSFQKDWTPSDPGILVPNEIRKRHMKIDIDIFPDDIEDTWLGFLASNNLSKKDWPLIRYMIEKVYIPKIHEDLEMKAYYTGKYKAPTAKTANKPEDVMDGLKSCIQKGVDADKSHVLTDIGALSKTTVFDQVEAAIDQISDVYQGTEMLVCMAPVFARAYLRDKRSQGFYDITSAKQIDLGIDFSPSRVCPLPSMGSCTDLFITPKANLLHITDKTMNKETFKIEESKRTVSLLTDWQEGVGIALDELVWTNITKTPGEGA